MPLLEEDKQVLKRYPRAIMHLRDRKRTQRLALGVGAGVSIDLGFPTWGELVARLEKHPEFASAVLPKNAPLTIRIQALVQYLNNSMGGDFAASVETEREARCRWTKLVHETLYKDVPKDDADLCAKHPYLINFLELIKKSPLTINYNFDDSLERMLSHNYKLEQANVNERIYETIWEPSTQFRRSYGVIYHPNGFLPHSLIEGFSDQLVFSEGEYADQLIDLMSGHYATLTSHLTRYTFLFLGLSLSDSTLKHMLRQNVHLNPGHVHYYVRYCLSDDDVPKNRLDAETMANYDVYGAITLHLTQSGLSSLGRLLTCADWEFEEALDDMMLEKKFVYYISGAVGAGKTSTIERLKSITTLSEWVEPRPQLLQKQHTDLSVDERSQLDEWISGQFRKKNFKLSKSPDYVVACDRTPLDPLAFVTPEDLADRAKKHQRIIQRRDGQELVAGQVIMLTASAEELMARAKERHKGASLEYLRKQQKDLESLLDYTGLVVLSTSSRPLVDVVRAVCKIIHLGEYNKFDVATALRQASNQSTND